MPTGESSPTVACDAARVPAHRARADVATSRQGGRRTGIREEIGKAATGSPGEALIRPREIARRALIGGVPLAELNALELAFLFRLDFRLAAPPADLARLARELLAFAPVPTSPSPSPAPCRRACSLDAPSRTARAGAPRASASVVGARARAAAPPARMLMT